MFENLYLGLINVFTLTNLWAVLLGVFLGTIIGILPGIGSAGGAAIMIPITYGMGPTAAISLLAALYCSATYAGSISAILFRIPGESASAATLIDGYPMAQKGQAGKALGTAISASVAGGLFSVIVLILLAPQLAKVALSFGPPEYFALACFGLSVITSLGGKSQLKGIISALLGVWFVTVGVDPIMGVPRFTFGNPHFLQGISYVPALIGIFGISEVLSNSESLAEAPIAFKKVKTELIKLSEFVKMKWLMLYSAILGVIIGILPGTGATTASIMAYNDAVRFSKTPEKFGTGIQEGVAAPETANNAATGGAMVPTLTLGIPGSSTTAVILAALLTHGIRPGPELFTRQAVMVNTIFWAMIFANILMAVYGMVAIRILVKCLYIPRKILNPIILLLCVVGAYGINNSVDDVYMAIFLGLVGYFMERYGFPLTPFVLGIILGPIAEVGLSKSLMILDNSFFAIYLRPISGLLGVLTILSLLYPYIRNYFLRKGRMEKAA